VEKGEMLRSRKVRWRIWTGKDGDVTGKMVMIQESCHQSERYAYGEILHYRLCYMTIMRSTTSYELTAKNRIPGYEELK